MLPYNIFSLVMLNYPLLCNYLLSLIEGPSACRKGVKVQVSVGPFVILVYPENGRLERTVCLHQILLSVGAKCCTNFQNVKSSFLRRESGKKTSF
jgi:hypothetical protein